MTFNTKSLRILTFFGLWFGLIAFVKGQLHDVTRTPNTENVGIKKSLGEQIGSGRGDLLTPGSSQFIIARDPFRAVSRGQKLFQRKFALGQGFGPLTGDGAGDIENDASIGAGLVDSCAGCHARPRGSAGFGGDVFTRPDSRDAPHLFGLGLVEMLADEITSKLRAIRAEAIADAEKKGRSVRRRLVIDVGPATDGDDDDDDDDANVQIDYGQIRAFPDGSVDTSQVEGVNPDLRVRPFFAQGGLISMREFIVGALNDEMGLEAIDPDLLAASSGGTVTTPSGMVLDGSVDPILGPFVIDASDDADGDGVLNEIPTSWSIFLSFIS